MCVRAGNSPPVGSDDHGIRSSEPAAEFLARIGFADSARRPALCGSLSGRMLLLGIATAMLHPTHPAAISDSAPNMACIVHVEPPSRRDGFLVCAACLQQPLDARIGHRSPSGERGAEPAKRLGLGGVGPARAALSYREEAKPGEQDAGETDK